MNMTMNDIYDAGNRKIRTENKLQSMGVTINHSLPLIEPEAWAKLRSPQDVARRVAVLSNVVAVSAKADRKGVIKKLKSNGLWKYVSPKEKAFFNNPTPSAKETFNASWRTEAIWVLIWALYFVPDLGIPDKQCDSEIVDHIVLHVSGTPKRFIGNAMLRPVAEILDASDFIYRAHWAARDKRLFGKSQCGNLDEEVLHEWHKAINWLTCYADVDWDNVKTDT